MQASDVMTTDVVTVRPDTRVEHIAGLLLERRISGVPVVDADGRLVGIVTEGDLMRRPEIGTERHRGWWLRMFGDERERAAEYARAHGSRAEQVMTRNVVTVTEETPLGEIARLLEEHRIKRVPVIRDGKVVGIVSRANLLHSLAASPAPAQPARWMDDRSMRDEVLRVLQREGLTAHGPLNVTVTNGVAELWGLVESEEERQAIRVAVENVPGVVSVRDNLGRIRPWLWGS
ncbi:MAG TPA: CBS domain-containing protein [Methylomirabilota bacterium]|jgi:CBS domain-containing protein|nr:CBS domain-containing protein [Methylomirabilota bacterium]